MVNLYCPYIATCPFYKAWSEQTREKRIDIIYFRESSLEDNLKCSPLEELDLSKKEILRSGLEKDHFPLSKRKSFNCSNITLLNLLLK